ncbi:MAG: T9SS type A sorting domain-containing protein [Bacteroidales bacterium]|nr:T9SS type A sorting domain-containing protein [Bacteroidales bacterium]
MKRFILSLFSLFAIVALQSQSLELYHDDILLNPNDTIFVEVTPDVMDQQMVKVKNTANESKSVKIKKYELYLNGDAEVTFCWLECYPSSTMLSPDAIEIESGGVDESFASDFLTNDKGISYVLYTFFDENDETDSVSLYFVYDCPISSIASVENTYKLSAYPNPAKNKISFNYSVNQDKDVFLRVYSITGQLLYQESLGYSKKDVTTLNLDGWDSGIYIYSLEYDNQKIVSKKFIVTQ